MSQESAQLELRQQLLAERFGPVSALVLERVLTAAERRRAALSATPGSVPLPGAVPAR